MKTLEQYLDDQQAGGRLYFTKDEVMSALGITADAFKSTSARLKKKNRLISPLFKRGVKQPRGRTQDKSNRI